MRDYHYREAVRFDHGYQKLADNIANNEIREVASAFVANVRRIESLHFLTPLTVFFSASIQAWILESQLKLVGNINESVDPDSELAHKITAGVNEAKTAWLKQWQGRSNDLIQYLWERGNDQLDVFLQQYGPELFASGVESLLSSMLIGAWTVFESFSTDLWVAALNANPSIAGYVSKQAIPHRGRKSDQESVVDNDAGKSILVEAVEKHGYDLRDKMGFVMKDSKKFNFNRLNGIVGAYVAALGHKAKEIFDDPKHSRLTVLEGIRNVIAHSAGKIDPEFKNRAKENPVAYGELADLPLNPDFPDDFLTLVEPTRV